MSDQTDLGSFSVFEAVSGPRRPRIALMGEFSAGKSTLANLMIGTDQLPTQVVATRLPPVWITHGKGGATCVDLSGTESPVDLDALTSLNLEDVAFIRLRREEEILQHCDIIDMPGISDPNMPQNIWERVLPVIDGVVWCSPATQAWRQSEASVWKSVDKDIQRHSMLLLTRADMLLTDSDKQRVLRRVGADKTASFGQTKMISLVEARIAVDDEALWVSSGAEAFVEGFLTLIESIATELTTAGQANGLVGRPEHTESVQPRRPVRKNITRQGSAFDPNVPESFTPKFS